MKFKRNIDCKLFCEQIKAGDLTLRRRFMLYVASAVVFSVMLLLLLLSLFGVLNPSTGRIELYLNNQLDNHIAQLEHDVDQLASYSVSFSKQMETVIEDQLTERNITFHELTNNIDALTALQTEAYATVYTNIRIAPCSGAFYILNTTVNNSLEVPQYNGIYLKFANLYAETTVNTEVALFRGASDVARENNINLFSTWQNEMRTDVFSDTSIFAENTYVMSRVTKIPDTWERARYIYSPIYGEDNQVIGICGFELNDLYIQLSYRAADTESAQTICALLDKTDTGFAGQFISNRSGYIPPICENIAVTEHGSFREYQCGDYEYIGKEKDISIDDNTLTVAIMFPKQQYESILLFGQLKNITIFFIVSVVALCTCLWMSKKYITPIKKSITEMQTALDNMNHQNSEAKQEIARLAYSRKNEVDPYNYEQFLIGVKTLTPMEKTVFNYYLEGKSVKEIVELAGIKESTVRFHNRNIYSKLGVNSLKQLLLYASIMKRDEENEILNKEKK